MGEDKVRGEREAGAHSDATLGHVPVLTKSRLQDGSDAGFDGFRRPDQERPSRLLARGQHTPRAAEHMASEIDRVSVVFRASLNGDAEIRRLDLITNVSHAGTNSSCASPELL